MAFFVLVFTTGIYRVILNIFSTAALDLESVIKESVFAF